MNGRGTGGDVRISAESLKVLNGAQLNSIVFGSGQGGDIILNVREAAVFSGNRPGFDGFNGVASGANSRVALGWDG